MKSNNERTVRVPPPDNSKMLGKAYIQPIEMFDAKGVKWTRQFVFKAKTVAASLNSAKVAVTSFWSDPVVEISNCGNTGSWALDGSGWKDCMCDDCISGRKEVKAGWVPK